MTRRREGWEARPFLVLERLEQRLLLSVYSTSVAADLETTLRETLSESVKPEASVVGISEASISRASGDTGANGEPVASAGTVLYTTGFEPAEGFSTGFIGFQGGWSYYAGNTTQPVISGANPAGGAQHLRLDKHAGLDVGTTVGAFSPDLGPMASGQYSVSVDVAISGLFGADYRVIAQSPSQGLKTAWVNFSWLGDIKVVDDVGVGSQWVDTGQDWSTGAYRNLTINIDAGADTIEYYYAGSLIYTGVVWAGTSVEEVILDSDNWNMGDVGDFDNLVIEVPGEPMPNLTPYQPPGWSDKIVVSTQTGTHSDAGALYPTDALYLDWAVINNGYEATESAFWTYLYVDGSLEATWSTPSPLSAGSYDEVGDYDLGSLGVGSHTIEIVADATGTVDESSEGDNTYTKNIVIGAFGEIHGSAWNDLDGDGIRDGGEPALADWKIYLDDNLNAQWDAEELFEMTDGSGNYSFLELPADKYIVSEELQEGWAQTSPSVGGTSTSAPAEGYAEGYAGGITTTGSTSEAHAFGEVVAAGGIVTPQSNVSGPLINIDTFRSDPRFAGMDGSGFAAVILDTGIDVDHPFFGPDSDSDGIADRIVYQWDYAYGDADASDVDGHGSNVSSIVASEDATYTGMAPGADIIHLKVLDDDGSGTFAWVESALQWVAANAAAYNIASVNMSLGDGSNFGSPISLYGIGDELAALAALDVIVVSAAGNSFYEHGSVPGIGYPAADANSLAIGAVYDSNAGGFTYGDGSQAFSTGADRITVFSQRHETMATVFAPGAPITGAGATGGLLTYHGTSQASPHIAGIAVVAQQLAVEYLGRPLTLVEFSDLLRDTAVTINDGDDEDDNVTNTGLDFPRVDMLALAEGILTLVIPGTHAVLLGVGEIATGKDFGNTDTEPPTLQGWLLLDDTGAYPDDAVTNDTTPVLQFTFSEEVYGTGSDIEVLDPDSSAVTPDLVAGWGTSTLTVVLPTLTVRGGYMVTLKGTSTIGDETGNPLGGGTDEVVSFALALFGDADVDGDVDGADLATLGINWDPASWNSNDWAMGNFDGDSDIDGSDFVVLGLNWSPQGYGGEEVATLTPTAAIAAQEGTETLSADGPQLGGDVLDVLRLPSRLARREWTTAPGRQLRADLLWLPEGTGRPSATLGINHPDNKLSGPPMDASEMPVGWYSARTRNPIRLAGVVMYAEHDENGLNGDEDAVDVLMDSRLAPLAVDV